MIRMLNNAAFALKNAYVSHPSMELQFVEDIYAELEFEMPDTGKFKLRQDGAVITCESGGEPYWSYDNHKGVLIPQVAATHYLTDFFFTIVLNYSAYSCNLYNFRPEWCESFPGGNGRKTPKVV